jgi:hypothetical protein
MNSFIKKNIFKPIFNHFTAGETLLSLNNKINILNKQNLYPIADYIREHSTDNHKINNTILHYIKLADLPKLDYIALKLSALNFNEDKIDYLVNAIIQKDKKVLIDAEEVKNQDKINDITYNLIKKYNSKEINIYKTYQMYRKDSICTLLTDVHYINNLGIKLVRGAYYNQDVASGKLHIKKSDTDFAYNNAMKIIFSEIKSSNIHAFICTHNTDNIHSLLDFIENNPSVSHKLSHASLYGFINDYTEYIKSTNMLTYKYLPYGSFDDSIPYLTRRLYENPSILYYIFK